VAHVLRIQSSSGAVREVPVGDGETTIGRDPQSGLVLTGRGVSRRHAKLICRSDKLTIVDLGSTYGTKVGGMPALRREVRAGDQIVIGMHEIEICRPTSLSTSAFADAADLPPLAVEPETPPAYFADEITHDPRADEALRAHPKHESSINLDSGSIQFLDDASTQNDHAELVGRSESQILQAVERLGTGVYPAMDDARATIAPRTADYHALLMMYKVSQLLGEAEDLDAFINGVADLVMEEVRANTVVVLTRGAGRELEPCAIRHRGALGEGEVPVSRGVVDLVLRTGSPVISGDAMHDDRLKAGQSLALYNIRAVLAAPLTLRGAIRGVLYLNRAGPLPFTKSEGELVGALAALMASGMERAELKQGVEAERRQRQGLERFHPPEVVEQLSEGGEAGVVREHEATALMCDVIGLPELTQRVAPQELAQLLGDYYELLYEKVFGNAGSLVKLYDGWALALFGMHGSASSDAVWAVEAARQLLDEFDELAVLWPGSSKLQLGVAVASGTVVSGVVGSAERLEYVALGKPVVDARALLAARRPGLLITEEVWSSLPQRRFTATPVDQLLAEQSAFQIEL
jgi:class 3 adenylate cyclase/pSer/pThr/pTyr-binding forkhead associated (FHA) protein